MHYNENEALGFIETVGMTPALEGTDKMLKAAGVSLVAYENIGSTLVSVVVTGDVGAVRSSVEAGARAAAAIGTLTAQNVIPRPISAVSDIARVHDVDVQATFDVDDPRAASYSHGALGSIETFGLVFVLEATDAMAKAAEVEVIGYENTASGYISVLVGGDVAACTAAVSAGVKAVQDMGAKVYSSVVIARPHYELEKIISQYSLDNLLKPTIASAGQAENLLGDAHAFASFAGQPDKQADVAYLREEVGDKKTSAQAGKPAPKSVATPTAKPPAKPRVKPTSRAAKPKKPTQPSNPGTTNISTPKK